MKILWIPERFAPDRGGVATAATRQVRGLAKRVERLDVLLLGDGAPGHASGFELDGAHVHRVGRAGRDEESLQLLFQAAVALGRAHNHDLVHGFYAVPAGYVAVLAARRLARPSLVSLRGNDLDVGLFQGSRVGLLGWTLEHATALAAVSQDMLANVRAFTDRTAGLHHTPNAVDASVFSPGVAAESELAALARFPRPWIAFAGEARFKKGLGPCLALAEALAARGRGTLFLLGGVRREARDDFERWLATAPAAAARLCELPYIKDREVLVSRYRAMDLFVFPSLWDGMPNALLEVMACGKPVIATAAGGIPDVIDDGVSGFLVPIDAVDRFPERVCVLLDQDLAAIGQRARERMVQRFAPVTEIDRVLAIYHQLVTDAAG